MAAPRQALIEIKVEAARAPHGPQRHLILESAMKRFAIGLLPSLSATAARADPGDYDHMMGWGGGGFGMVFGPVLWLIVLGLVVAGVIWLVRRLDEGAAPGQKSSARAELDLRLARGEIDAEEYASRKRLLGA